MVISDAGTCIGGAKAQHDLSGLDGHRLRTHGGVSEGTVPFIFNRPLTRAYAERAAAGGLKQPEHFRFRPEWPRGRLIESGSSPRFAPPQQETNVMRSAKAAVCEAPNTPFVIKEYPLRPVQAREVLVRVKMATICRSDIHSYEGRRPNPFPGILGHEIIGVIEELGRGVERDMRGDRLRVAIASPGASIFFDGDGYYRDVHDMPQKCQGVRKYGHEAVDTDPHFLGGFAEYCYIVPGTWILKLPDELSDEEATPLNCGVATMVAVTEASAIALGDTVVVQGLGLLGLYGLALAKARGARFAIGLDTVPGRLETAKQFGADMVLDVSRHGAAETVARVRAACPPDGADVCIEVCGVPEVIAQGLQMLRVGGRYTLGGLVNPGANVTLDANLLVKKWITLRGIHNYHPRHLVQALDFVRGNRHRVPFHQIVDSKFSLQRARPRVQEGSGAIGAARGDRSVSATHGSEACDRTQARLHRARPLHRRRLGCAGARQQLCHGQPVHRWEARRYSRFERRGRRPRLPRGEERGKRMAAYPDQGARALPRASRPAHRRAQGEPRADRRG